MVVLWTIRLSARAGAHIEYSSRSRAEDMAITNVIIKTPDKKWDRGVNDVKRWGGKFSDFEKDVNWNFDSGPGSPAGGWLKDDVGTVSIVKIVSLTPRVEKLKVNKWINVSYLNNESRQCFADFPTSEYFTYSYFSCMLHISLKINVSARNCLLQ